MSLKACGPVAAAAGLVWFYLCYSWGLIGSWEASLLLGYREHGWFLV